MSQLSVLILCGGKGTRIQSILGSSPKILAPINDKLFLDYLFIWLQNSLPSVPLTFYLSTCIGHDLIQSYVSSSGLNCILSKEEVPLGTFGAILDVVSKNNILGDILVLNGDTIFDVNFSSAYNKYLENTHYPLLIVKQASIASRYGGYIFANNQLKLSLGRPDYISLGAFFCSSSLLHNHFDKLLSKDLYLMLDKDFLDVSNCLPFILPHETPFIDIGVPSDYSRAKDFIPSFLNR